MPKKHTLPIQDKFMMALNGALAAVATAGALHFGFKGNEYTPEQIQEFRDAQHMQIMEVAESTGNSTPAKEQAEAQIAQSLANSKKTGKTIFLLAEFAAALAAGAAAGKATQVYAVRRDLRNMHGARAPS